MRHIGHFLDQSFGDADSKRLSVPERFASLETAVSQANNQLNSLTRVPLDPAGLGTRQTKSRLVDGHFRSLRTGHAVRLMKAGG
jgi:hypothetical protein